MYLDDWTVLSYCWLYTIHCDRWRFWSTSVLRSMVGQTEAQHYEKHQLWGQMQGGPCINCWVHWVSQMNILGWCIGGGFKYYPGWQEHTGGPPCDSIIPSSKGEVMWRPPIAGRCLDYFPHKGRVLACDPRDCRSLCRLSMCCIGNQMDSPCVSGMWLHHITYVIKAWLPGRCTCRIKSKVAGIVIHVYQIESRMNVKENSIVI